MKPSEDVHGDGMLVAEVALQDVQRLDEVVACVDFVAAGFLKLGEITEGVAERRVIRVQFLFSQIDCFRIKAFGLFQLLPALMLRTLLEEVGDLGERGALRALLGKLFSQLGYLFGCGWSKLKWLRFAPSQAHLLSFTIGKVSSAVLMLLLITSPNILKQTRDKLPGDESLWEKVHELEGCLW